MRHTPVGEAALEGFAALPAVDTGEILDGFDSFVNTFYEEAGDALFDDLGDGTQWICNDRKAACYGFDEHDTERFGPVNGKQQGGGISQKFVLLGIANLADELDEFVTQHGFDVSFEIIAVTLVNLGGDFQRHLCAERDLDGAIHAFLGGDSS